MHPFYFLIGIFLLSGFNGIPGKYHKSVQKEIDKVWRDQDVFITPIEDIPEIASDERSIYTVRNEDKLLGYLSLQKVTACEIGGCTLYNNSTNFKGADNFIYMALIGRDFEILHLKVIEYNSEYGYEITSRNWLKQFYGKKGSEIKYGENIDAITGATVSAEAISYDLEFMYDELKSIGLKSW